MSQDAYFSAGCLIIDNKEHDIEDVIMLCENDTEFYDVSFNQASLIYRVVNYGVIKHIRVELSHVEFHIEYENETYIFKLDMKPGVNPMITFFHNENVIDKDMAELQLELFES